MNRDWRRDGRLLRGTSVRAALVRDWIEDGGTLIRRLEGLAYTSVVADRDTFYAICHGRGLSGQGVEGVLRLRRQLLAAGVGWPTAEDAAGYERTKMRKARETEMARS